MPSGLPHTFSLLLLLGRPLVRASCFLKKTESTLDIFARCGILETRKWKANFPKSKIDRGEAALKNRLEALRKQRGINQEQLADALEVSRQTIGSLENGRYNPSILLAFKISRYFGLPIEEIFIYEEE